VPSDFGRDTNLFSRLESCGTVLSIETYDIQTIGLIQQYIERCHQKYAEKQRLMSAGHWMPLSWKSIPSLPDLSDMSKQKLNTMAVDVNHVVTKLEASGKGEMRFRKLLNGAEQYENMWLKNK